MTIIENSNKDPILEVISDEAWKAINDEMVVRIINDMLNDQVFIIENNKEESDSEYEVESDDENNLDFVTNQFEEIYKNNNEKENYNTGFMTFIEGIVLDECGELDDLDERYIHFGLNETYSLKENNSFDSLSELSQAKKNSLEKKLSSSFLALFHNFDKNFEKMNFRYLKEDLLSLLQYHVTRF